jgi:hypothetical protein
VYVGDILDFSRFCLINQINGTGKDLPHVLKNNSVSMMEAHVTHGHVADVYVDLLRASVAATTVYFHEVGRNFCNFVPVK